MFDLDIKLFNYIYSNCMNLGKVFNYGAFEGLILYSGVILLVIVKVKESTNKKVKK